jgi:hypothetical protein
MSFRDQMGRSTGRATPERPGVLTDCARGAGSLR